MDGCNHFLLYLSAVWLVGACSWFDPTAVAIWKVRVLRVRRPKYPPQTPDGSPIGEASPSRFYDLLGPKM